MASTAHTANSMKNGKYALISAFELSSNMPNATPSASLMPESCPSPRLLAAAGLPGLRNKACTEERWRWRTTHVNGSATAGRRMRGWTNCVTRTAADHFSVSGRVSLRNQFALLLRGRASYGLRSPMASFGLAVPTSSFSRARCGVSH